MTEAELPGIIRKMERRLSSGRGRRQAPVVWAAAYILLGLRHSPALAAQLFRGVVSMKESSTYQAILEEGRAEGRTEGAMTEARKLLLRFGARTLGPPDVQTATTIDSIDDLARLEALLDQLPSAASWNELLRSSSQSRRGKRRQSP